MKNNDKYKTIEKESRIVEFISSVEINKWKKYFVSYGRKTEFESITGISRQSLNNVLNSKKGLERIVETIRNYYSVKSL